MTNKTSLVSRRAEMFGGLAKTSPNAQTTLQSQQSKHRRRLSEATLPNFQSSEVSLPSRSPHLTSNDMSTAKNSTNEKNRLMLSLPPNISSPLTTPLWLILLLCNYNEMPVDKWRWHDNAQPTCFLWVLRKYHLHQIYLIFYNKLILWHDALWHTV